jgi:hypothetical protein
MGNKKMNTNIVALDSRELELVDGGTTCGQDVAGALAAGAGVVGAVLAPVSFGVSLGAAALFGLAAGIMAGEASTSCR